jgi:hypothetical protein
MAGMAGMAVVVATAVVAAVALAAVAAAALVAGDRTRIPPMTAVPLECSKLPGDCRAGLIQQQDSASLAAITVRLGARQIVGIATR